ncbi:hypothetical protein EDB86DRAFT_2839120 [Lactarius hatsudake]|nr:hypothetical protein EDB86DRAFT_2839120 [Lactarius hatsudake]
MFNLDDFPLPHNRCGITPHNNGCWPPASDVTAPVGNPYGVAHEGRGKDEVVKGRNGEDKARRGRKGEYCGGMGLQGCTVEQRGDQAVYNPMARLQSRGRDKGHVSGTRVTNNRDKGLEVPHMQVICQGHVMANPSGPIPKAPGSSSHSHQGSVGMHADSTMGILVVGDTSHATSDNGNDHEDHKDNNHDHGHSKGPGCCGTNDDGDDDGAAVGGIGGGDGDGGKDSKHGNGNGNSNAGSGDVDVDSDNRDQVVMVVMRAWAWTVGMQTGITLLLVHIVSYK